MFASFDTDGNGTLDTLEFRFALDGLGIDLTDEALIGLFATIDTDGSGDIDYEEFLMFVAPPEPAPPELAVAEPVPGEAAPVTPGGK